jgi:hypothetical protein
MNKEYIIVSNFPFMGGKVYAHKGMLSVLTKEHASRFVSKEEAEAFLNEPVNKGRYVDYSIKEVV